MSEQSPSSFRDGFFFEELYRGQVFDSAPGLTITSGHAATHQAILGDRLRLALDAELSHAVTGSTELLAHPAFVWDIAIGHSTLVTRRVVANLFYRGLVFHRAPVIGDTLRTTTEVLALRENRRKVGRAATGLAVLRIRTSDQHGRSVLDFLRCAMLPLLDPDAKTGAQDDLDAVTCEVEPASYLAAVKDWDLTPLCSSSHRSGRSSLQVGRRWSVGGGDVVSSAPELARLTLNVAAVHHDETLTGRRLVYGGHTIGIAAAQLARTLPQLVTILAWHGCDHLAPVYEGDTLRSDFELESLRWLADGPAVAHIRARVDARRLGAEEREVLDWRLVALLCST